MATNNVNFRVKNGLEVALNASIGGTLTAAAINSSAITTGLGYTPVNKAGDTMLGALNIGTNTSGSWVAALAFNGASLVPKTINFQSAGNTRWYWQIGDGVADNMVLNRCNASGSFVGAVMNFNISSGAISLNNGVTITGGLTADTLSVTSINATPVVNALQPVPVSTIVTSANSTLSLTLATHNNTVIVLSTGTILNINYANLANGFTCTLINNTGADLTPTLTGFTATTITNSVGAPKLSNNGMATILAYTPDGGTTKICRVAGEVTF